MKGKPADSDDSLEDGEIGGEQNDEYDTSEPPAKHRKLGHHASVAPSRQRSDVPQHQHRAKADGRDKQSAHVGSAHAGKAGGGPGSKTPNFEANKAALKARLAGLMGSLASGAGVQNGEGQGVPAGVGKGRTEAQRQQQQQQHGTTPHRGGAPPSGGASAGAAAAGAPGGNQYCASVYKDVSYRFGVLVGWASLPVGRGWEAERAGHKDVGVRVMGWRMGPRLYGGPGKEEWAAM